MAKRKMERFPPSVWAQAKAAYHGGMSVPRVEATYGIKENTFRVRAHREGWTRDKVWAAEAAALAERASGAGVAGDPGAPPRSEAIAEAALHQAQGALGRGDAVGAIRIADAAVKVGELAELVKLMRARGAGDRVEG